MSKDLNKATAEQAGGDERVIGWRERILAAHPNSDPGFWPDALLVEHMAAEIADLRAALAQPSPAQSDASFEEWLANELEGEDGQPVPAAVCDIALARRAFNHWPKLEKPAQVGGVRFSAGVSSRLVVEAAQRLYEFESTPEQEAERIERLQAFREQLDPLNLAPHAEAFNEAPAEALKPEQAEAERPELWAVHAQGPDELYAAFSREDAEKHAAELNALAMPEGITVDAVVVSSPWPPAEHWQYLAEQERDHKNEIAVRLRQFERICEGLPQDAIDGCWTVQGIRRYAKRLEDQLKSALARVAELEKQEPVAHLRASDLERLNQPGIAGSAGSLWNGPREGFVPLYAAPVAQAQPEETPGEILAAKLIETWVTKHGKPAPWSTAVEITAVATNMPNDERDRLLALDDDVDAQAQHCVPEGFRELLEMLVASDLRKIRYAGAWRREVHDRASSILALLAAAPGKEEV
ncbi:hypothetical protein [Pseudomonas aeruginosa]|uniref:hypothetical protein n=1 Tax=Pseudomonas aeruginosa TaxID=287 RepID=UPI001473A61D|nr:hypothetical protein [Pseudomonas aeruginosa]